ncbi:MAG TPA: hypothetical protein VHG70_01585 [Nocardioidaceae bacterium]|nr:hypothetical protein [Nocardioidaceae bacterium]
MFLATLTRRAVVVTAVAFLSTICAAGYQPSGLASTTHGTDAGSVRTDDTRAPAVPIPQSPTADAPRFVGEPARPHAVSAPAVPRHPYMAPNGDSNLHDDAYATDTYDRPGPLGRDMKVTSTFLASECASVTFDSGGRLVAICVGVQNPNLLMLHPHTLDLLAQYPLPPRQAGLDNPFTEFSGGGYFYLDDRDRAVIPTTDRHIYVVRETRDPLGFERVRDYDLNPALGGDDAIVSALPDFSGRVWFVSRKGVVGYVDPTNGSVHVRRLASERITDSFAVDESGGVYVVSNRALYRFGAGTNGAVQAVWRREYPNTLSQKPGQVSDGSGTTPSLMGNRYVAITDNADPMNVTVYRRGKAVEGDRVVCREPVFERGRSATDNSLIVTGRSIVVENNFGYTGPASTTRGSVTEPGLARVDLDDDGTGCHTVWTSDVISPTVVPKLSLPNGLVYVYSKTRDADDPWYFTAVDFHTGEIAYKRLTGFGMGYNNNYAPITIGPDGTAYVGALGGLVALHDSATPIA